MNIFVSFTNSADSEEMPPSAAFHLGLHRLQKYLFAGIKNEKYMITLSLILNFEQ